MADSPVTWAQVTPPDMGFSINDLWFNFLIVYRPANYQTFKGNKKIKKKKRSL